MDEEIKKEFEKVWAKLKEIELKSSTTDKKKGYLMPDVAKKLSIKEFIIDKSPSDDIQRATCIAEYLDKLEGKARFTTKDISNGFKNAKLKTPENVSDKIQQAIKKGWIAPGENKGEFYITLAGEKMVGEKFVNSKDD